MCLQWSQSLARRWWRTLAYSVLVLVAPSPPLLRHNRFPWWRSIPRICTRIVHRRQRWTSTTSYWPHCAKVPQIFIDGLLSFDRRGLIFRLCSLFRVPDLPVLISRNKLLQSRRLPSFPYEIRLKQLFRIRSFTRVFPQTKIHELLKSRRKIPMKLWRWILRDQK